MVAGVLVGGFLPTARGAAAELTTLASFSGLNGALPYSGLLLTADGSFFGTTSQGGTNGLPFGYGTIFRLNSSGVLTTLFSFNNTNGAKPYGALALGGDGNLYGTTWGGGISNVGTAFRVTTNGLHTTLLSFSNVNGAKPSGRLIKGQDGHFYGTTQFGGATNQGTVFRLTTNGVLTTLASFSETNGANPYAEVVQGLDGHLYGTTVNGGPTDVGAVFRVTTNGVLTLLHIFSGPDGANPYGGLVQDPDGILYGTTAYGGANGYGTIYKITTNSSLTTLYSFTGGADGANPWASLLRGSDGFLYGTTILGGGTNGVPRGVVFQITTNGLMASLASFEFDINGISPYASVVQDAAGNLYGTTWQGGAGLKGTVFRLTPSPQTLQASLPSGNIFRLTWDAWLGKQYQLQYKTNPIQPSWIDFGPTFVATNSPVTIDTTASGALRFYRARLVLPP